MITIFNRKELIITYSLEQFNKVADRLAQNRIAYTYVTSDRQSPSPFAAGDRARQGSYGQNRDLCVEYKIYVHRHDYALASSVINEE